MNDCFRRERQSLLPVQRYLLDEAGTWSGGAGVLNVEALQVGVVDAGSGQRDVLLAVAVADSRREDTTLDGDGNFDITAIATAVLRFVQWSDFAVLVFNQEEGALVVELSRTLYAKGITC